MFSSSTHSSSGAASPSFPLLLRSASRGITTVIKIIQNSPRIRPNIFTDCSPKLLLPVFYLRGKMESAAPASSLSLTLFNPFISSSQLKSRLYTSRGIVAHSDVFCFVCSIASFSLPPRSPCLLSRSSVGALQCSRLCTLCSY